MTHFRKYLTIFALLAVSCVDERMFSETELLESGTISIAANSARLITKSGLQYENFDPGTRYLLYALPHNADRSQYDWDGSVMYGTGGTETEEHLIDYGKDIHYQGKTLDFYGVTLCDTQDYPLQSNLPEGSKTAPSVTISLDGNTLPDIMSSNTTRQHAPTDGLVEMNFIHNLSKIQFEISKHDDDKLENVRLHGISIRNTCGSGTLSVMDSTWTLDARNNTERIFSFDRSRSFIGSDDRITTSVTGLKDSDGNDAYMLIFPNGSRHFADGTSDEDRTVIVSVLLDMDGDGIFDTEAGDKIVDSPVYKASENNGSVEPFEFRQNYRYVLSIAILNDGVRILAVRPQVYEWIPVPLEPYMGQPVTFGDLMWMDRNLGATSADCRYNWPETRGFYYQFGRNIPFIFDAEKFINRSSETKVYRSESSNDNTYISNRGTQVDIGYEYFYTYNERGERVYGAVQGGILEGSSRYMVTEKVNSDGTRTGWVRKNGGWEWEGWNMSSYTLEPTPHYESANGGYSCGNFYRTVQTSGNINDGETNWESKWKGPDVTSSNIAINPGDVHPTPGKDIIYHFIFDARFYHDYYQSGAWCVTDCVCKDDADGSRDLRWLGMTLDNWENPGEYGKTWVETDMKWKNYYNIPKYGAWMLYDGCWETRLEDTQKVNYYWADADGNPKPSNHPCPKGWRIPTKEDFSHIFPDHTIHKRWASTTNGNQIYILNETAGDVDARHKEAAIYGIDSNGNKVIYLIKRKGQKDAYRLRLKWITAKTANDEDLTYSNYYNITSGDKVGYKLQYLEISRYPGNEDQNFDSYFNDTSKGEEIISNETDQQAAGSVPYNNTNKKVRKMSADEFAGTSFLTDFDDWENPTETLQIPICGFIYTTLGVDGMYDDGNMTILRCSDWSTNYDVLSRISNLSHADLPENGTYDYNEAMNWCAYIRTDQNTGLFSGSRKSLGCQIRCVRDMEVK